MNKVQGYLARLKTEQRRALIPFITAGLPTPETTHTLMHSLVKGGADMIELGIPFSDPMADGPIIQRASERALGYGVNLEGVLKIITEFRVEDQHTPVILMGYLNPLEIMGYQAFGEKAKQAGVDAILVVDLPPEEANGFNTIMQQQQLEQIFLVSPTTSTERIRIIAEMTTGFIYYVSLKGITGSNRFNIDQVRPKIAAIREITNLPIGIGFGVKDSESIRQLGTLVDAIIVGSALIDRILNFSGSTNALLEETTSFIADLRTALDHQDKTL